MADVRTVTIPACEQHDGFAQVTLSLPWVCLHCGGPRGEPYKGISYDGSRRLAVDCWTNPCGHGEKYSTVRAAASGERFRAAQLRVDAAVLELAQAKSALVDAYNTLERTP